jgi:hypothetical protein
VLPGGKQPKPRERRDGGEQAGALPGQACRDRLNGNGFASWASPGSQEFQSAVELGQDAVSMPSRSGVVWMRRPGRPWLVADALMTLDLRAWSWSGRQTFKISNLSAPPRAKWPRSTSNGVDLRLTSGVQRGGLVLLARWCQAASRGWSNVRHRTLNSMGRRRVENYPPKPSRCASRSGAR